MALSFILPLTRSFHHSSFALDSNSKSIHIARTLISAISTPTNTMSSSSQLSKTAAPYGSWKSPITSDVVSGSSKRLGGTAVDSLGRLIWLESRPTESGRSVLVREAEKAGEEPVDITPKEFGVRTLAQEYGGGAFRVFDGVFDARFNRYVTVQEDRRENKLNPTTTIVAIGLGNKDIQEPEVLIGGNDFYAFPRLDSKGEKIAWIEWSHPNMPWDRTELWVGYISETGRSVLVREAEKAGEEPVDITPKEFGVRTLAQEYGGGAFRVFDGVFDARFNRYVTVQEDRRESKLNPTTTIVAIGLGNKDIQEPEVLIGGNDFYAFPRLDSKGEKIAWIEWSHPNMPWDRTELWVGYISETGEVYKRICVAGSDSTLVESPTEPKWSPDGELFFITDRKNGFWNIYKWIESENEVVAVYTVDAEFSGPLWVFGLNSYEFIQRNEKKNLIACSYRQNGRSYLGILDYVQGSLSLLDIPFTDIDNITSGNHCLYVEGASAVNPSSVAKVILDEHKSKAVEFEIIWSSSPDSLKYKSYFSLPELIEFPTEVPGQNAYAFFYPPTNPVYQGSQGEKPPLLLKSHGGPTAETRGMLNLSIQYWTSRGWAFVDVNYGGSTGYGREYRDRLLGRWGIVDVNDCCSCAKFLVDSGKVDGERLCITGGSAGGYTTLAALAFKETFKAGASLYGVADLGLLRAETHKFESHYIDNLVGNEKAYFERSPINFVDKFSCPIILFQGLEDKVVPPDQARKIYQALKEKGLPVALVEYEGEQHGFRKTRLIRSKSITLTELLVKRYFILEYLAFAFYVVADLGLLRAETHKFESHYIDNLVGNEKAYFERSPINFVDKFSCPIILFQGLEDKVVPPDQARKIYQALKEKGLPVALVEYEGEQHGFRKAENIKFTLEQQMVFFARLVGHFDVADEINPIKVDNFD
ncbi:acylamino-acid-releasing enzyme [Quercus suber]|uniref:Acylamino-acid-releasing enzyme n=1 Tax=Quercus suber TaxID=58331 RepID=A0AAW0JXQ0_QUESU